MFYHDIKEHCSPSALAQWHQNKSGFIRSYFKGEKTPETAAMRAGKKMHALREAGVLSSKCAYGVEEEVIEVWLGDEKQFKFLGIPDDRTRGATKGVARFMDLKTGKENHWAEKLPTDIKMKATAWLVWKITSEPKKVEGTIEYVPTEWDASSKEVVQIEGIEPEMVKIVYDGEDLREFEKVIVKAMNEINAEYEKWKESTDELVSEPDMETYAALKTKKDAIETEMKEVAERILSQMEAGGTNTVPGGGGTFFVRVAKTYEYPKDLAFKVGDKQWTLEKAEEVGSAMKSALKNYELTTEPKSVSTSLNFRPKKEKQHESI